MKTLASLLARGLSVVDLIIRDAHAGLQSARKAVLNRIPWQRCQPVLADRLGFHLQQNASQYVPWGAMSRELAADIRAIFNSFAERHASFRFVD